jgi:hypothetical protein
LFAISSGSGSTFIVQLFVVNFNFSFSIGLRFRAGHYKIPAQQQALLVSGKNMRPFFTILTIFLFISASGQKLFDSLQVEMVLTVMPTQTIASKSDKDIIRAIEVVDKKYRLIADTLYNYKSLKHTILQTIFIETNDSVSINPLTFGDRLQTKSIIFNNRELNIKVDSMARSLKKSERNKLFNYLTNNFDNFSIKERKLNPQPVRIRYIKFADTNLVHVGIDIYGKHFLWTIDKTQNWDIVKVEDLLVY